MVFDPSLLHTLEALFTEEQHVFSFKKGTYLFQEGEAASNIFWLQSGKIQIGKVIPDGRELTIRISKAMDMLIEMALFEEDANYTMNARAIESGEALVIPRRKLESALSSKTELMVQWLRYTHNHHLRTQSKLRDLVLNGKKGGVYSTLIRMGNTFGEKTEDGLRLNVSLTNQEMANLCGTSREVVNRLLSELRKEGIIKMKRNRIILCDIDYLKQEVNCENCPIDMCQID
ncbi:MULTISPECIES: Crp/Fnr family transcriptional regulator [Bacillaceae]|uniref:Crp/Fnr family transcriptional regulator n=1 Tax=Domibacillus aminovorans TaxID=29332 RepID=A0A177L215_9BACI|nr:MULTISPECIES: Crp/Fnr family transcriptional regulator [Bacillaceae]OAH59432.1 Crp/Fnr family transcriptional regulator [Domibacillus aminovorans]